MDRIAEIKATIAELETELAELETAALAAVELATDTTVYPVKVGRGAAVHAAGYIGGDFNEVQNWTACGTTSPSLNRSVRRAAPAPVEITCTKCLKVEPARRR